jgi:plasmid maintenance system antidote protein VapI
MDLKEKIEKANIKVSDIAAALDIPQSTVYRCINNQGYISNYLLINKYVNEIEKNIKFCL